MYLTQRNQYALRAIVELARRVGMGPVKVSEIAKAQAIPLRFLEVILGQLKGSGLVDAKRGYYGGYFLLRQPEDITVGSVVRFLQGEPDLKECQSCISKMQCPFEKDCAFASLWSRINTAVFNIYDETTIKDLVPDESAARPDVIL